MYNSDYILNLLNIKIKTSIFYLITNLSLIALPSLTNLSNIT